MAMFEVEGESKIEATDCTTTSETLVQLKRAVGKPQIKATNCHSGVSRPPEEKPAEPTLLRQALKWTAEAAIKWAVPLLLTAALGAALAFWPELKSYATKIAALILQAPSSE